MFGADSYETFLLHNAYSAAERAVYTDDYFGRGHSTKVGQHSSVAHTKARKAKRRMNKRH